ncbi:MAG TPA: DUF3179 domain-containing (seleno)protein [Flavobacteriales bacterium]|nr:DUF3179 domain-containing (seleno)protein [Flavobacteriales bacterium]
MKTLLFFLGVSIMIAAEICKALWLTPAPGMQQAVAIEWNYFFHNYIWFFRIGGLLLMLPFFMHIYPKKRWWAKILFVLPFVLYGFIYYECQYDMFAEEMFSVMGHKQMKDAKSNTVLYNKLVVGVDVNGNAHAYPIEIIGYHHQVMDTIDNIPVIVSYCTVCRTGRVYKSTMNGKSETFRLVGMDMFNAMLEDNTTGSWWQQATGECVAGPKKGEKMEEVFSQQMSLGEWIKLHPTTLVLQPEKAFQADYDDLKGFDDGTIKSSLEGRDTGSWKFKSWVVGIQAGTKSYVVDWNDLQKKRVVERNDFVLIAHPNKVDFVAFSPVLDTITYLELTPEGLLHDKISGSHFNFDGKGVSGRFEGKQLKKLPAYQEFYHSWTTFHPRTIEIK